MSWDNLEIASFGGVEFSVESLEDSLTRRQAEYKYPWRNGADCEDLGREARTTSISAIIFGDNYEVELGKLMQIADDGLPHEFIHLLLGAWNARIRSLAISHQSSARNFVAVKIEIVEDGVDSFLPEIIPSMEQLQTDLDADIEELDQQRVAYGIGTLATAITRIQELKKNIESQIYDVQRKVDTVRKALDDSMDHARKLTTPKQWPVVRACRRTARNCMKLAERVQQKKPIVRGEETNVQAPISVIAHARYGDSKRAEELIAINNLKNPFLIPPGTQLKVYAD